jgi:hypothetical protein
MKITIEPTELHSFNSDGEAELVTAVRVEWQAKPGGKREHVNIVMESARPNDMLHAAAAYFQSTVWATEPF